MRFLIIFTTLIILIALAAYVYNTPFSDFDLNISKYIQSEVDEQRYVFFPLELISLFGNDIIAPICVVIVAGIFYVTTYKKEAAFILGVFISDALIALIKLLIHRPRPTADMVHILRQSSDYSFPSGHVVHYIVFFGFLSFIIFYKKLLLFPYRLFLGVFFITLICTIPLSRIYVGAHWFTDTLGGLLIGVIFLFVMVQVYLKLENKISNIR